MSQIRIPSLALGLLLSLSLMVLSGCGDKNSQADFDSTSAKHPASWLPKDHSVAANKHSEACTECHGGDFSGGISKIACTKCHLGNQESFHPVLWGQFAYALHGAYANANGIESCKTASCHGATLAGVTNSGPSCTKCHMGGNTSVHPTNWVRIFTVKPGISPTNLPDHGTYVNANGSAACVNTVCHGAGGVGVFLSGRSCGACHV